MKLIDHTSARAVGLTLLAGIWAIACGNNDTPNNGFAANVSTSGGTSTANTITGGTGTGGARTTGGAPQSAGGTAATGGSKNATGGTSASAGGTSATTGGTSTASAGTSTTTGGVSITTGGTAATTGGTSAGNGGTTAAGGTSSAAGGTTTSNGGTSVVAGGTSAIGGTSAATGGVTSAVGGTATATGGDTSATGGTAASTGGTPATGGTVTTGGAQGTGGSSSGSCPIVYDFESDVQGWSGDTGLTLATSATNAITGSQALKVTMPAIAEGTSNSIVVNPTTAANLWPGTVVTLHVMIPAGVTNVWLQAFSQGNNYSFVNTTGNSAVTVNPGGWTTWTYTIPNTFPGGIQVLGIQIGVYAGGTFAAGDVYVDSITACAGSAVCGGNGTGSYSWETAGSVDGWSIDGNSSPADTAIAQSTTMPNSGAGSLQITFSGLPTSTARRIILNSPKAYCGQVVTYKVYVPADFNAGIALQPFSNINGLVWDPGSSVTPTPGAWNTLTYTLPQIGPLGLQRIGLQISASSSALPYSGSIYLDDVTWGGAAAN